jgi:hypothetical protein
MWVYPVPVVTDAPLTNYARSRAGRETGYYAIRENKKVFPEVLIAPARALGHKAIDLRIMDDAFFDVVANFIEYNRFTMKRWLLSNCNDYVPVSIVNLEEKILAELQIEIDVLAVDYVQERSALEDESKSYCLSCLRTLFAHDDPPMQ